MVRWREFLDRMKTKRMKERRGFGRDVLLIGYTGYRTFVDPKGDLYNVIRKCGKAKIMLLNPFADSPARRLDRIFHSGGGTDQAARYILRSIEYLKSIRKMKKDIRLKLYLDAPFLKLLVLGDRIWIQYYQTGQERIVNSEYLFKQEAKQGSLYAPFFDYFWGRWNDARLPEYDLDTDELIYRDPARNEEKRKKIRFPKDLPPPPSGNNGNLADRKSCSMGPRQLASILFKTLFPANIRQTPGGG